MALVIVHSDTIGPKRKTKRFFSSLNPFLTININTEKDVIIEIFISEKEFNQWPHSQRFGENFDC